MPDEQIIPQLLIYLKKKLEDLTPQMRAAAGDLKDAVMENFEKQSAAGKPWARLAKSTVKQRAKKGYGSGKILQRRGGGAGLKGSITSRYSATSAEVGTKKIYAAIHQYGGIIHRSTLKSYLNKSRRSKLRFDTHKRLSKSLKKNGNKMSSIRIPARPFLVISEKTLSEIKDKIMKSLLA